MLEDLVGSESRQAALARTARQEGSLVQQAAVEVVVAGDQLAVETAVLEVQVLAWHLWVAMTACLVADLLS